jgi:hypothetical protein
MSTTTKAACWPVVRFDLNQGDWTVLDPGHVGVYVGGQIIVRDLDPNESYRALCVVIEMYPAPYGPGTVIRWTRLGYWLEGDETPNLGYVPGNGAWEGHG